MGVAVGTEVLVGVAAGGEQVLSSTYTLAERALAVAISRLPSRLKSRTATESRLVPTVKLVAGEKPNGEQLIKGKAGWAAAMWP